MAVWVIKGAKESMGYQKAQRIRKRRIKGLRVNIRWIRYVLSECP